MPALLCTLGSSWAVVPEAFLMGNGDDRYDRVSVLATSGIAHSVDECRAWFGEHAPGVRLRIFVIEELPDIRDATDHARYEEALFRVYAHLWREVGTKGLHVCLAGGFKTISSAAHQTADLFGCAKLFHITSPVGERFDTHESIVRGIEEKKLSLVDLGPRPGWPTIQQLLGSAPDLPGAGEPFLITDTAFRETILNRIREANRLAQSEHELSSLPFPQIARWSPADRHWLQQPLDPDSDGAWVASLPKVELHCHLGGFATHGELLRQVREAAEHPESLPPLVEPELPEDWPLPDSPVSLSDYMKLGDANGSALLKDPGCLRRQCELLYQHLVEQNIRYAEIRCSPANYTSPGRSAWTVLNEIKQHFDRCKVAASLQLAESGGASLKLASTFIPYDRDATYHQTWRDLPHRHQDGTTAFVTFRLNDSLPKARLQSWHTEQQAFLAQHPKPWDETTWKLYRRRFPARLEEWLDEAQGECRLADPNARHELESTLRHFDGERYVLDEFVIMPNHVHVLLKPLPGHELTDILRSWKSYSAKTINRLTNQTGQLWEHESFDHLVRSEEQLEHFREYIRTNPEKAGLKNGFTLGKGTGLVPVTASLQLAESAGASLKLAPTTEPSHRLAPTINLILIGTRKQGDHRTAIMRHLMLAVTAAEHWQDDSGCRVVGVDLAGFEDRETRAHYYREDFRVIHRAGLALTVHAGENDEAEGIWSAVFDLNTRRIGHALSLGESPELLRSVADRRIGVEMCPYANCQIKGFALDDGASRDGDGASRRLAVTYPLKRYLEAGVPVTVNTDNIGISGASLTENFLLAARLCPDLTRLDVLRLIRNAIDQAFVSTAERAAMLSHSIPHPKQPK